MDARELVKELKEWTENVPCRECADEIREILSRYRDRDENATAGEVKGLWKVDKDEQGYACGISLDGYRMLQLNPGTVRNEEQAQTIVNQLNSTPSPVPVERTDGLREALEAEGYKWGRSNEGLLIIFGDEFHPRIANRFEETLFNVLSRHPASAGESLAELADRKGFNWVLCNDNIIHIKQYFGGVESMPEKLFEGKDYPEAESKARAYLNGLPDADKQEGK